MRTIAALGAGWRFLPRFEPAFLDPTASLVAWEPVDLPHTNHEFPLNAFDERDCQFVSTYALDFHLPSLVGGQRAFLDFEGVMTACEAWVNGRPAGSHRGGYTPFSLELTGLGAAGTNRLVLKVDSTERADIPPFGHVVDYLCYGGIYRGASLRIQEAAFLADVFARPDLDLHGVARLDIEARVDGWAAMGGEHSGLELVSRLLDGPRVVAELRGRPDAEGRLSLSFGVLEGMRPWDLASPYLYGLETEILGPGGALDSHRLRLGFRRASWTPDGFFLNGRPLKIAGLNRHQAYPYAGYAMPARAQRRDAEILKRELGVNLVRTSHYPQARAFLDACDELGLLVFEELPGWQHIGDRAWQDQACADLEAMILRDRSRPSVVLWGARINESKDDHAFYARTNEIAHRLDPSRATGGVRYLQRSELLEDVYTFNDFVHNGSTRPLREPRRVVGRVPGRGRKLPYLVTEHNGHMYPTKRYDNEERLLEHALRHARVLDAAYSGPGIAGAIGWCAFDYNTHKDFGSGDRVCYHGVSDMFRIPKHAAALYASQKAPADGLVLEAASLFAKGERSGACVLPIQVYTNCDEVLLYRAGRLIGGYRPDRKAFPGLPHPPVVIDELIGSQLEGSDFSLRDREVLKGIVGKILSRGLESLGLRDRLSMAWLLLKNRMSLQDGEELVGKYVLGWGAADESWELVGMVDGAEAIRRRYGGDAVPASLLVHADDLHLKARGAGEAALWGEPSFYGEAWDATRVEVRLVDQYGNLSPFAAEWARVEVSGPGRVIGPATIVLQGGCAAFWVRTSGEPGPITVQVRSSRFTPEPLVIQAE